MHMPQWESKHFINNRQQTPSWIFGSRTISEKGKPGYPTPRVMSGLFSFSHLGFSTAVFQFLLQPVLILFNLETPRTLSLLRVLTSSLILYQEVM